MKTKTTYFIQVFWLNRRWSYVVDNGYRVEAGSLEDAKIEAHLAFVRFRRKVRILKYTETTDIISV